MPATLHDFNRRVLGNLPRYRTPDEHAEAEAHMREVNGYPEDWTLAKKMSVEELVARLDADEHAVPDGASVGDEVTEEHVTEALKDLEADGHVRSSQSGWSMTKAGFEALTGTAANEAAVKKQKAAKDSGHPDYEKIAQLEAELLDGED